MIDLILIRLSRNFDQLIHVCPSAAIRYDSQYYDVDMLMKEIESDRTLDRVLVVE